MGFADVKPKQLALPPSKAYNRNMQDMRPKLDGSPVKSLSPPKLRERSEPQKILVVEPPPKKQRAPVQAPPVQEKPKPNPKAPLVATSTRGGSIGLAPPVLKPKPSSPAKVESPKLQKKPASPPPKK